jgi:hypothetical protein
MPQNQLSKVYRHSDIDKLTNEQAIIAKKYLEKMILLLRRQPDQNDLLHYETELKELKEFFPELFI